MIFLKRWARYRNLLVRAEAFADDIVFPPEEVIAEVAQEVEMADEIRHVFEDGLYRVEDAPAHVVHQGDGPAELFLYVAEEGDDVFGLFRRKLHVSQHDVRD